MVVRLKEAAAGPNGTLFDTAIDALGACMLVTILLDAWRLLIGGIVPNTPTCVPFM